MRLSETSEELLLVVSGDLLTDLDSSQFVDFHRERRVVGMIGVYERQIKIHFRILEVSPEGVITECIGKPDTSTS